MGGKKKGKKGSKKGKKGGKVPGDDLNYDEKNWILEAEWRALEQREIIVKREAGIWKAREQEAMHKQKQLYQCQDDESKRTDAIIADMTRQYKSTDQEMSEFEQQLAQRIEENEYTIDSLEAKKQALTKEKEKIQHQKEEEIKELTNYIEAMNNNFSQMLEKTLKKMKDKIARANKEWEEEQDQKMIDKFQDIINEQRVAS